MSAFSSQADGDAERTTGFPEIRVLFAAWGWPSGTLDVGSWVARCKLATLRIVQLPDPDENDDATSHNREGDDAILGAE
ncbi:MAG: hypothetical protein D6741_20585, partial [Planctomycetota bacterium]